MNTRDILTHMITRSPWVDPKETVDSIKAGDGDKPVGAVGVCWYSFPVSVG